MNRGFYQENFTKLVWIGVNLVVALIAFEIILQSKSAKAYYVWPPHTQKVLRPLPGILPGISGETLFRINSFGIRGDVFSDEQKYRILAIGGSTTECGLLDESEAWPYLTQRLLNQKLGNSEIWVGNVGKSGHDTRNHIFQFQKLLLQYPKIDAVILLTGVNDLTRRLRKDGSYRPFSLESPQQCKKVLKASFSLLPPQDAELPFYKRTGIYRLCRKIKKQLLAELKLRFSTSPHDPENTKKNLVIDEAGRMLTIWRKHRKSASAIRNILPDLSSALSEYTKLLETLIDIAKNNNTRIIFLTQPTLWDPNLPEEIRELLWFGGLGRFMEEPGKEYYSVESLAVAMKMYNEALVKVCKQRGVECVDIASLLPKNDTVLYDDCHLNERGSKRVAEILSSYWLEHMTSQKISPLPELKKSSP